MIHPKDYKSLRVGTTLRFQHLGRWEDGRLLYCWARKNFHLDKDGTPTDKYDWVQHRCGYEPVTPRTIEVAGQALAVFSCHLEAGWFTVSHV
jgi:hypothetical protein